MNTKLKSSNKSKKHFLTEVLLPVYFLGIFIVFIYTPIRTFGDFIFNYLFFCIIVTVGVYWGYHNGSSDGYFKRLNEETKEKK
jgi:hypothetical protein